ncbi:MAG: CHASE2 domain-containing protein [Magnetococcales bacterium]|nr:CHASE2 domain-containing protein [Magnetococcales bacterium]
MKWLGKNLWSVILLLIVLFIAFDSSKAMQRLEIAAYDLVVSSNRHVADGEVMLVAIDNRSLNHIGSWPWSRKRFVELINILSQGVPKILVNTMTFSKEKAKPKASELGETLRYLKSVAIEEKLARSLQPGTSLKHEVINHFSKLRNILMAGLESMDEDQQLVAAYKSAGNVIQGIEMVVDDELSTADAIKLPEYLLDNNGSGELHMPSSRSDEAHGYAITLPDDLLGKSAAAVGVFLHEWDFDGVARKSRLVVDYAGVQLPSLALAVVAKSQNIPVSKVEYRQNHLDIGHLEIGIDKDLYFYQHFYDGEAGEPAFKTVSFFDLLNGRVNPEIFYNKIVLVGATAVSISPGIVTPVANSVAPVVLLAQQITTLLNQAPYRIPSWAGIVKITLYIAIGGFLLLLLPKLPRRFAVTTVVLASLLLVIVYYQLLAYSIWVQVMGPLLLLVIGSSVNFAKGDMSGLIQISRFGQERDESQRMLGLAFQGQGQLDLAFAKFVNCKLDSVVMEMLYDLATDYERNRRFEQSIEVLQYISAAQPEYRDVPARLEQNQIAINQRLDMDEQTSSDQQSVIFIDRYSLGEELGRGALGTVFLGRDSRENRLVAVKLIPMVEIFEASMMEDALQHFVEILKTVKSLDHPNIVKVLNGGDSYGRAYMVMEHISGRSLSFYVQKEHLLPLPLVIQIVVKIAMALDFAQQKGAIHGNLKPSNILFDPESKDIKIVDFALYSLINLGGSRMISLRPHAQEVSYYLSPECSKGAVPDCQSDIFSLGVIFYKLLTGESPFALNEQLYYDLDEDLIYDPPKPVSFHNRAVPPCLNEIIDKMLSIDPQKRFVRGALLAKSLVNCVKRQVSDIEKKNREKL